MKYTIATFNMQNGQPWNDSEPDCTRIDLEATIAFLHGLNADLLFLQEVEQGHDGGMQVEPPPNFTAMRNAFPDWDAAFAYPPKNSDELPFGIGLGIFSKFPLSEKKVHALPAGEVAFDFAGRSRKLSERILQEAWITLENIPVRLLNTHLQAFFMVGASSEQHRGQRDEVERILLQGHKSGPVLLAGDFNIAPDENLPLQFEKAGYLSAQTGTPTWKRKPYVVDHVFFNKYWKLLRSEVIPTACSDHHAVVAEMELIPAG